MISGVGLASAMIKGFGAMVLSISGLRTPAALRPRKMSAPSMTSASVAASDSCANAARQRSIGASRPVVTSPSRSATQIFSRLAPMLISRFRHAIAAAPAPEVQILTSSRLLPASRSPLRTAAAAMIAVPC